MKNEEKYKEQGTRDTKYKGQGTKDKGLMKLKT
jgi:hypothetical protein